MNKLTYLAIPYTFDPDLSFKIANEVASELMNTGKVIFSPVSHSHPISDYMPDEMRTSQEFWMIQDLTILYRCDELYVIVIGDKGHTLIENSKGCMQELRRAQQNGIKIKYYYYESK